MNQCQGCHREVGSHIEMMTLAGKEIHASVCRTCLEDATREVLLLREEQAALLSLGLPEWKVEVLMSERTDQLLRGDARS